LISFTYFSINVITFLVYAHDKFQAIYDRRRVPEATLLTLAAIGGAFGALCAMWLFRHKIQETEIYALGAYIPALSRGNRGYPPHSINIVNI